jgi:Tol biopolymer transport system component
MLRLLVCGVLLCLTCAALAVGAKIAGRFMPEGDRIAYYANDEIGSLYALDITRGLRITLATRVYQGLISFSPDGDLVFGSRDYEVFSVDRYGSMRQLSPEGMRAQNPVWSPDGTQIAFSAAYEGEIVNGHLAVMDSDGQNRRAFAMNVGFNNIYPMWTTDGAQILLPHSYINSTGFRDLMVDVASGSVNDLYTHDGIAPNVTYAASGNMMLLAVTPSEKEIYLTRVLENGSVEPEQTPLFTVAPASAVFDFQWSPDGSQLAFTLLENGDYEIMILDRSGELHNLSANPARDWNPVWSPDGTQLMFLSNRDGLFRIYVVNADGSNLRLVVNNITLVARPAWLP